MLKRIKDVTEIEADMICSSQNNNCDNCPLYDWHSKECMVRLMNQKIEVFDPKNNIEDRNKEIYLLSKRGYSKDDLAKTYGLSKGAIINIIRMEGLGEENG